MLQYDLQRAADKLIKEMFELKEGENVVISCDTSSSMDVVNAVASSARAAGGCDIPYSCWSRTSI